MFCGIQNGFSDSPRFNLIFSSRKMIFIFLFCAAYEEFLLLRYILFVLQCLPRSHHLSHPFFLLRINVTKGSRLVSIVSLIEDVGVTPPFHFEICNSI